MKENETRDPVQTLLWCPMGRKKLDLTNQTFGRWLVLEYAGLGKNRHDLWKCRCTCPSGTVRVVSGYDLRRECSQSCGCLNRERVSECRTTHGMINTRLYRIWKAMLTRAGVWKGANEQQKRDYIDRGTAVCDEWQKFENFRDWALSNGYRDDLQIDREDNDKGYCPENCRWVTPKENVNNRRNTARLEDGTSLAMFCSEVGIQTCENGKVTKQYGRIYNAFRKGKIHPELHQQLKQDVHNQARTLYEIAMKRQALQDRVKSLRRVLEILKLRDAN